MKSLILSIAFVSTSFFGLSTNTESTFETASVIDEDALYCSAEGKTADGAIVEVTCWFCDCQDNIDALNDLINDNRGGSGD